MYSTRQVAELLNLPMGQVRQYARSGFLSPVKDDNGAYRFDFQDLVLLRTAVELTEHDVPHRRVRHAFRNLKSQLSEDRPLTEVTVAVVAGSLMAQDGETVWNPDSGQLHMNFGSASDVASSEPVPLNSVQTQPSEVEAGDSADEWYEYGCESESINPLEAIEAYRKALAIDPTHADAHINLGRLIHGAGNLADAVRHYRAALRARPGSATAWFNMGISLEDSHRNAEAIDAYNHAIGLDPDFPDPHFNLAALYEKVGDARAALRHFRIYRKLTRS